MRPIDADALGKDIEEAYKKAEDEGWKPGDVARTLCAIVAAPTLDLEPVRRGMWIPRYEKMRNKYETVMIATEFSCSVCGIGRHSDRWNYCPNCGARMDLKECE